MKSFKLFAENSQSKDDTALSFILKNPGKKLPMHLDPNRPFDPDPPKKKPNVVPGKHGSGPSLAKHLAKMAMKKQMDKKQGVTEGSSYQTDNMVSHVKEAGPFSYGSKPPRKGSVAYNALMKRKEQEKNKPPIEPKDQMVGTAKLVKEEDHELKAAIKRRDENRKKMKFSDAEHIYAKEFDAIMKKRGYGKHNPIPLRLSDKDIED